MATTGKPRLRRKGFEEPKAARETASLEEDGRWWVHEDGRKLAGAIRMVLERNWRTQEQNRNEMSTSWRLYENAPIAGLTPRMYRPRVPTGRINRISWNLVRSVVDTYVSMITKEVPKVSFDTMGANRDLQLKAERTEAFVEGVLYDNRFDRLNQLLVRNSALFPFACVQVYADWTNPKNPRIAIDQRMSWDDHTNEQDAVYGDPQNKQVARWVDKHALAAEWADGDQERYLEILRATQNSYTDSGAIDAYGSASMNPQCLVIESWHLPRVPGKDGSKDGRHVLSVGDVVLKDEPWYRPDFGLVYLYRYRPVQGIWAQSLPIELAPLQVEIARTLHTASLALKRAVGHVFVEEGSEVNTNAIDDRVFSMIKYRGTMPTWVAPTPFAPELLEYLNLQWQRGFESIGISQTLASSERPAGLNSGKAQLVYADIQQQRFLPCYREYQQFYVDLVRAILAVAKEIADEFPDFAVKSAGKNVMAAVRYLDAHMEQEEYVLKLLPTNKLADDPAAKFQFIQDQMNAGLMDQKTGRRMMDNPDTKEQNSYDFAAYNLVAKQVTTMLTTDEGFQQPDPRLENDLPDAIEFVRKAYLKAQVDGEDPKRVLLLDQWLKAAESYLQPPPQPAAPPPPDAGAPPPPGLPPAPGGPIPGAVAARLNHEQAMQTAANMG